MTERFRSIVDVHVVLVRHGMLLLTRRANTGYADSLTHFVSGHLERDEDVVAAAIREVHEEVGIGLAREDLTCVHVMHHRNGDAAARVGFFFRAERWDGEPANCEPHKCSELVWVPEDGDPPADMVPYPAEAWRQMRAGAPFSLHGWA